MWESLCSVINQLGRTWTNINQPNFTLLVQCRTKPLSKPLPTEGWMSLCMVTPTRASHEQIEHLQNCWHWKEKQNISIQVICKVPKERKVKDEAYRTRVSPLLHKHSDIYSGASSWSNLNCSSTSPANRNNWIQMLKRPSEIKFSEPSLFRHSPLSTTSEWPVMILYTSCSLVMTDRLIDWNRRRIMSNSFGKPDISWCLLLACEMAGSCSSMIFLSFSLTCR